MQNAEWRRRTLSAFCILHSAFASSAFASDQNALRPAGPQAAQIASLWWLFFWVCAAVYVIVIAVFIGAIIKGRRRVEPLIGTEPDNRAGWIVAGSAGVAVVLLIMLMIFDARTGHAVGHFADGDPKTLEINVTGHQWWWEVKYPDPLIPAHQINTANEIHIPINTPVQLRVDTRDVIHSLWIPNLQGKRDLIPGRVNKLRLQADTPGVYRAQCAEYCGLQHAHMSLVVIAETPEDFARWKTNAGLGAPVPATPEQIRGQQVFLRAPCGKCHNILGIDAYGTIGPDLTHGNLAGWIVNAPAIKPGAQMPPVQLSAAELNDLLAYLETLK
jgi:cytochrome c oxidase subunit 2